MAIAASPLLWLYLFTAAALSWLWWRRPNARKLLMWVMAPLAGLAVVSTPAFAYLALGSLEWRYPPSEQRPAELQAIVVLGGYLRPPNDSRPQAELGDDSESRCIFAARLYRAGDPCEVVVSGGKVDPHQPGPTLAAAMADFLVELGVPRERILLEDQSTNTYENAVQTSAILHQRNLQRVVLVTDAAHLWRAESCFRNCGVDVIPRGVSYGAESFEPTLAAFVPTGYAIRDVERAVHEWVGMGWYLVCGRI